MPLYEVADDKGRTLTIEGDSPPTEQELEELFASTGDELAGPKAVAPWMFQEPPSSLTPQSDFGMPATMVPSFAPSAQPVNRAYTPEEQMQVMGAPRYIPRQDLDQMRDVSQESALADPTFTGGGAPAFYNTPEERQAAWMEPNLRLPSFPTVEEVPPSLLEKSMAPTFTGPASLLLGQDQAVQIQREAYNLAKGIPEFISSGVGLATLPAGAVAPRLTAGVFTADMLRSLLEQDEYLQANWDQMTGLERTRALTGMGFTGALAGTLAKTTLKPWKSRTLEQGETFPSRMGEPSTEPTLQPSTLGQAYARTFSTPTTLHGDVRPRQASAPFVPVTQSRPGVRTEAERLAKEAPEEVSLTPAEHELLMSESWSVDLPVKVVQRGPRARTAASRGQLMGINFKTGEIEVYPANFRVALEGVPEAAQAEFIRSRLQGEQFHKSVFDSIGDSGAREYWGNLTRAEQMLAAQIYLGRQNTTGFNPAELGHEVIRRRLQRLESGTPEEMVGIARTERWTLKSLQLLEDIIRKTRENVPTYGEQGLAIGTKAARANQELMGRLDRNLAAARQAITGTPEDDQGPASAIRGELKSIEETPAESWSERVKRSGFRDQTSWSYEMGRSITSEDIPALQAAKSKAAQESMRLLTSGKPSDMGMKSQFFGEAIRFRQALDAAKERGATTPEALAVIEREFGVGSMDGTELMRGLEAESSPASVLRGVKDDTGVTAEQHFKGIGNVHKFQKQFRDSLGVSELKEQIAEFSPQVANKHFAEVKKYFSEAWGYDVPDWEVRNILNYPDIHTENSFIAQGVGKILGEIEPRLRDLHERLSDAQTKTPSELVELFLYEKLTRKPYNLTSEEVGRIIGDYKNEGRKRLYDLEPGLGRLYDTTKGDTYRKFTPESGADFDQLDPRFRAPLTAKGTFQQEGEFKLGPASVRRGPMSKRGEDAAKLAALRVQAEMEAAGELPPPEPKPAIERPSVWAPLTPQSAQDFVKEYISTREPAESPSFKVKKGASEVERNKIVLSFDDFHGAFQSKFGPVQKSSLRELFGGYAGEVLMAASGKRIGEILKNRNLVKNLFGGGKPGEKKLGQIADAEYGQKPKQAERTAEALEKIKELGVEKVTTPKAAPAVQQPRQLMMTISMEKGPVEISKELDRALGRKGPPSRKQVSQAVRLRHRAIAEILYDLYKEMEGFGKSLKRTEIDPLEELADPRSAKEPVFADIRASELTDVERLGAQLTSDARSFGKPVSASKRLVTLLNRESGAVDLVDIYLDPRRGAVVMSPTGAGAHQTLESVMKTHRPVHSILLDEPVQNFRKRYKSLREFNEEFGGAARDRARASQYEEFTGEPVGEVEFEPGMVEGSGTMARPEFKPGKGVLETGAPLTDAEARSTLEYIKSELPKLESADDVALIIENFKFSTELPVRHRSVQAMSGIIKMVKSQMDQNKNLTEGEAIEQVSRFIYETQSRATPEQFVSLALANYRGRIAEAGEPVGPAPIPTARELTARTPGRIEGVGGGLASTMQRGTEVRQAAAEKTAVRGSRWIQRGALAKPIEESAFDRVIKETSRVAREAEAEVARDVPRREQETTEQWLERVREEVARLEEFKAAQDQAKLAESMGPASVIRGARNAVDAAEANMVNEFILGPAKGFADWYSGWLTQNIRRNGGAASGQAADIGDAIIDRTKQIYGKLTPLLDQALVLAGGTKEFPLVQQLPTPKQLAATIWLNRISHPVSKDTAVSRTVDAVEGNINIPAFVADTVNAARASNLEIGGLILEHPQGKFQRNMTAWGYDMMMKGPGRVVDGVRQPSEFDIFVRDNAKLNARHWMKDKWGNVPMDRAQWKSLERQMELQIESDMRELWSQLREENLKPVPDINRIEKINQDFIRLYPETVTHLKTKFGYQQVIHTDLHNYLKNSALRTSHVAAFRERFPNTEEGRAELAALDRKVRDELGANKSQDWDALVKTLQGRPTDSYNRFGPLAPGTAWGEFTRALNDTAVSLARRAVLTGQMVTQLPETVVSPFVFFSPKNVLQSAVRFKELWSLMETTGQINKLTYDFSFDPANPFRSFFRFTGNVVSKAYFEHFLNEFQGKWFAANATVAVERMLAGKMSARELRDFKETLRQTGFTKDQVSRMVGGDAELLGQFKRRMPAWAVGENKLMAEGSRLGANRLFNSVFRFQMYPMLKMNQFRVAMGRVVEAVQSGNRTEIVAANKRLAELLFGTAIQGAMLSVLSAYAFGGPEGLDMKLRQAVDEPVDFVLESLFGGMSGPLYLVWSGARYGGWSGIGEQATRLAFPFSIGANLVEAATGSGQYKDMDEWDRMGKFLSQKTPGYRIMKSMIAQWGLGQENPKLEANLKALAQWKRDRWKNKKFPEGPEYNRQFRIHMKKAVEALKIGDTETYLTSVKAAAGVVKPGKDPAQAIRDSFNARRVLRNPDTGADLSAEEKDDLVNRIGQDAYNRLQYLDLMLKTATLPKI